MKKITFLLGALAFSTTVFGQQFSGTNPITTTTSNVTLNLGSPVTSTPLSQRLNVAGNVLFEGNGNGNYSGLLFDLSADPNNLSIQAFRKDNPLNLGRGILLNKGGGFVGVGISSPLVKFHVANSDITSPVFNGDDVAIFEGANAFLKLHASGQGGIDFASTTNRVQASFRYNFANNDLFYTNSSGEAFRVMQNGNFGIGTNAPSAKLHVNATPGNGIRFQGVGEQAGYVLTSDANGNASWQSLPAGSNLWQLSGNNINYLNGNVGVGASSPTEKFHVKGGNVLIEGDQVGLYNSHYSQLNFTANSQIGSIKFIGWGTAPGSGQGDLELSSTNIRLLSNTFVSGDLDVTGKGQITQNVAGVPALTLKTSNSNNAILALRSATNQSEIQYLDNVGAQMSVLRVNKVNGVGSELIFEDKTSGSAVEKLKVGADGTLYAKEIKVLLPVNGKFPDYVFDSTYQLMPLNELNAYVQQNHHLPNINTAQDIKENGLTLGDMQVKQMEKIEELTLYIIDLNTKVLEQQKLINDLSSKLKH